MTTDPVSRAMWSCVWLTPTVSVCMELMHVACCKHGRPAHYTVVKQCLKPESLLATPLRDCEAVLEALEPESLLPMRLQCLERLLDACCASA